MSIHQAFRRQPVPQQAAPNLRSITLPAPTRGIILNENFAYMKPGGAMICDNWAPTLRGVKLRGGCIRYCDLHALDAPAWANATLYNTIGAKVFDAPLGSFWTVAVSHTSAATGTFAADRLAHPTYWTLADSTITRLPVISAFEYASGNVQKMFAGQTTKLFDVTAATPILVKSGQTSGNYVAAQLANASGDHMLVANDAGDYLLHYNGTTWTTYSASQIIADPSITPPPSCATGHNLTYVWKYRNRYFFIEGGTMNAWYLPTNAVQGTMLLVPLAGAATKGGKLLWGATWSLDAGDGIDEKCVFGTDQGELLIFTGTDPSNASNWRQEGRYSIGAPMGMNAHVAMGGDLLLATVDGITPISAAITKDSAQLDLNMITVTIKPMWRDEVAAKRSWSWTMKRWDEYGAMFVTWPGGAAGNRYCAVINTATGAWARFVGYDATCFARMRADMFFGNQDGRIMQADRTGYDDGVPYVATLVGGWEMFQAPPQTVVWHQARASFSSGAAEPFQPQLSATTDYVIVLPQPPPAGPDPGLADVWDQGLFGPDPRPAVPPPWRNGTLYNTVGAQVYDPASPPNNSLWNVAVSHTSAATGLFAADRAAHPTYWTAAGTYPSMPAPTAPERAQYAQWDQPAPGKPPVRNTGWVSIGLTGYSHAPIVQTTVAQQALPDVELISVAATYEVLGVNV